jgi:FAD binding domain
MIQINKNDINFEQAIFATMFNQNDPKRRPDTIVYPKDVTDIQAIIKQAKTTGKKISVCSGGHSWSQNHVRNESILISMKNFNQYEINRSAMTAKAGPGVGGSTLLSELFKQELFFPAGHCKGVCIGGYLLQGGFAWNGRKLGMACESVIGLDIVTAEGEFVHANEQQNADLYWAARGAGGGFFGVVTCFHLRIYPRPKYYGMITHAFNFKHLEDVYHWAYEVGPTIPQAVEFQMIMSRHALKFFGDGIEAFAPIFAESRDELEEAKRFMLESPIKNKAFLKTPFLKMGIKTMYHFAMSHYPYQHHWGVDNMWTNAPVNDLLPHIKEIAATLPPPPAHFLWLNWYPPTQRQDMAFSMENNTYLALYGAYKNAEDAPKYGNWATQHCEKMAHLGLGIQLADENLHRRTARFMSDEHLKKITQIRADRDPKGLFNEWHSKPITD